MPGDRLPKLETETGEKIMIKLFKSYWDEAFMWAKISLLWVCFMLGIGAIGGISIGLIALGYRMGVGVFG